MVMLAFIWTCYCWITVYNDVVVVVVVPFVTVVVDVPVVVDVDAELDAVLLEDVVLVDDGVSVVVVWLELKSISLLMNNAISILPSPYCLIAEHMNSLNNC